MGVCLVAQLCMTLCDPCTVAHQSPVSMGILQARILEWIALCSFRGSSQPRGWTHVFDIEHRFFTIWVTRENSISQNWNPYFQKIINRREHSQQTLDIHAHVVVNIERETLLKTGNGANWERMLSPCQHCTLSSRYCNVKKNKISTGSKKISKTVCTYSMIIHKQF